MQQINEARSGERRNMPALLSTRGEARNGVSAQRPKASLVHRMPGRARFRIDRKRNDNGYFDSVADRLRATPGVTGVETNPNTGSVLVHHEGPLDGILDEMLGNSELGQLVEFALTTPPVARRLKSEITVLDNTVQRWSGGDLDLGMAASFGLLGLAAVQLFVGLQVSGAVSLAWYAAELVRRSNSGEAIGTPGD
jgi:hypothetical protein